jgi:signal transduction histidine kinase
MITIAENIHHELNTPLEVIDNKIEKIRKIYLDSLNLCSNTICDECRSYIFKNEKKMLTLEEDFEFIKTSSEQIYSVLNKMKNFKHLRYSNGNKSVFDIATGGFKIINISNSNFDYYVDENLENYSLKKNSIKNAEMLSIFLNHIKNSLEANASIIKIFFVKEEPGFIIVRIIDNGNGIPENAIKHIFKPNFSTKDTDEDIRGNGMYLNKHILSSYRGNIKLIETSNKGTTLELKIPAKKKIG